jgi:ubiquinone/menaquinone biosynthesis C-methylase UbiE
MSNPMKDQWAQWLLHRRHGGDPEAQQAWLEALYPVRDQVLRNAKITEGEVVLDVGTGDGLIAFQALAQVGERGQVIFSDISQDLLDHCQSLAHQLGMLERCRFLQAAAEDLAALADASIDVVTTRSVLIYVTAKPQAFREFYRVLKPNGRLSIFEPINRFSYFEPTPLFWGHDVTPIRDLAQKVNAVYDRIHPLESDPLMNFDERDLLTFTEQVGFAEIQLELQVKILPPIPGQGRKWESFLRTAPNPRAPTIEEAINQALTRDEAEQFMAYLRPLVETQRGAERSAVAYLWAVKP